MNNDWTCYICLERFDIEIEPSFSCQRCLDGKQCQICFNNILNNSQYCGVCRHPIPERYQNQILENNQNRNNEVERDMMYIRIVLSSFFLFILDCSFLIVMICLKKTKCSNFQNLLFPIVFICKNSLFSFMNYIYIWCFTRVKPIHLYRCLEHIGFYICCFYYFYHQDNICDLFINNYLIYYVLFLSCTIPLNLCIFLLSWYYDSH